ncbi:MAG TPA: site-specific DNA-methyltransferase [Actinomycetota bacterium]|nr:site-specific DNA-methyltransferase [Actinomycetota bacterium]
MTDDGARKKGKPGDGRRRGTSTSSFGASRRESHDATAFYARFTPPEISDDTEIAERKDVDEIFCGDARAMDQVDDNSVALVVTSPPYFAGKRYEQELGERGVPATYFEYLQMLEEVFAECVRKLEPGGRIAVNVANLGRRPYRSLSSDVIHVLERLGLLLRGEVIWQKARGAAGSCAWGSFQRPANPVLRDLTERIVIASKGRFDRALSPRVRLDRGLPHEGSIFRDEFMEATTDVWEIPPESASRVGHPAPFPVELPERLIYLYTYRRDLVLDPFAGSGTTAVAAVRTERHFAGYDTDQEFVRAARARVARERAERAERARRSVPPLRVSISPRKEAPPGEGFQARAVREGRAAKELAEWALRECNFTDVKADVRFPQGVEVNFEARDAKGRSWFFDVSGGFTSNRPGLRRMDTLWKALGKATVVHEAYPRVPLVLLTTHIPAAGSAGAAALEVACGPHGPVADVVGLLDEAELERLRAYCSGDAGSERFFRRPGV